MSQVTVTEPPAWAIPGVPVAPRAVDPDGPAATAVAELAAAVDKVIALDPVALSELELLAVLDGLETTARRIPAARDPLVREIDVRSVPHTHGYRSTARFVADRWNLSTGEAHDWTVGAELFTPKRSVSTGEELPARMPALAAARAAGTVSGAQTRTIVDVLTKLPVSLGPDVRSQAETAMVSHAATQDPHRLGQLGQRLIDALDPDGRYKDPDEIKRRRSFTLGRERDGLTPVHGNLDPWTAAAVRAVLEPLARPGRDNDPPAADDTASTTDSDSTKAGDTASGDRTTDGEAAETAPDGCARTGHLDPRTSPQRMHDALREAMQMLLGSDSLPTQAGLPATILVITTLTDLEKRLGIAVTATGGRIPVRDVIRHASKARIIDIVTDDVGNPLYYGRTRRLASLAQRHALAARDRGCVIPGCTVPASRTEAHHLTGWALGGLTDIDNLALLCSFDHDHIDGWTLQLRGGRIWCTPPPWLDPTQTPRLNTYFHDPPLFNQLE